MAEHHIDEALMALRDAIESADYEARRSGIGYVQDALREVADSLADLGEAIEADHHDRHALATKRQERRDARRDDRIMRDDALELIGRSKAGLNPHGFHVYVLWGDSTVRPLYVGLTTNLFARLGAHLGDAEKRHHVRRVVIVRCTNEGHMTRTEARLIRDLRPQWNVVGVAV